MFCHSAPSPALRPLIPAPFSYDGDNIAMDFFDADGPTRTENGKTVGTASIALENRYLWGFKFEELLAQDHSTSANATYWLFAERQGTIRQSWAIAY